MAYKVELLENKPIYVASMKMTIPDYSAALAIRAVKTMENELKRHDINFIEPNYNFAIAHDSEHRIELIDVEVVVAVDKMGNDTNMIHFTQLPESQDIIRVTADVFEDVHIGLAEWMHDNDYEADGILRAVIHEGDTFIYDCPIKVSED
ncbi:MAG: hypothetical protein GX753_06205 [Erysipelothrix sp.]|nr:hypothetical protein [Erysipelothrix sp.]